MGSKDRQSILKPRRETDFETVMNVEATAILAIAIILSAFSAILGQSRSKLSSTTLVEVFIVAGLGLCTLLTPLPFNRYVLIGVLGFAGYSLYKSHGVAVLKKTISLAQLVIAILLVLASSFADEFFGYGGRIGYWGDTRTSSSVPLALCLPGGLRTGVALWTMDYRVSLSRIG